MPLVPLGRRGNRIVFFLFSRLLRLAELPETSFTRSISNPEAVMRRRRQQKLERKLQLFRSKVRTVFPYRLNNEEMIDSQWNVSSPSLLIVSQPLRLMGCMICFCVENENVDGNRTAVRTRAGR